MVLGLLLACIKPAAPVGDGGGAAVNVYALVDGVAGPVVDAPGYFDEAISATLSSRQLKAVTIDTPAEVERVGSRRDTASRVARLGGGGPSMLVETRPSYYSEMNGQYRWTVGVTLSLVDGDRPPVQASFDVPVFLAYHHEREAEAVTASAPVVARRVGQLIDTWLAGRE